MSLVSDDAGEATALHHLRLQLPKTTSPSGWRIAVLCTGRPDDGWDVLLQSDDENIESSVLSGNYSLFVGGTSPRRFRTAEGQIIVPHQKLSLADFSFTQNITEVPDLKRDKPVLCLRVGALPSETPTVSSTATPYTAPELFKVLRTSENELELLLRGGGSVTPAGWVAAEPLALSLLSFCSTDAPVFAHEEAATAADNEGHTLTLTYRKAPLVGTEHGKKRRKYVTARRILEHLTQVEKLDLEHMQYLPANFVQLTELSVPLTPLAEEQLPADWRESGEMKYGTRQSQLVGPHDCHVCHLECSTLALYKQHVAQIHKHECTLCGERFASLGSLYYHWVACAQQLNADITEQVSSWQNLSQLEKNRIFQAALRHPPPTKRRALGTPGPGRKPGAAGATPRVGRPRAPAAKLDAGAEKDKWERFLFAEENGSVAEGEEQPPVTSYEQFVRSLRELKQREAAAGRAELKDEGALELGATMSAGGLPGGASELTPDQQKLLQRKRRLENDLLPLKYQLSSVQEQLNQVNQLLNMYEQHANRAQYEKLQEQLHTQLAQLQNAYNAKAEELEEVCKNVPFEAKLHHAILKPPPQTTEESQYRCTVCSRPLKSILGMKAHMQTAHTDIYNKIISLVDKKLKELQMALGGQLPGSLAQSHLRIMAAELAHESAMQFGERFDEDFLANLTREMYKELRSHLTGRNRRRTAPGIHSKANLFQEVEPDVSAVKRDASYASRSMHPAVGEREYHCSDCAEVFVDQIMMLRHIRRVHLNRTRFGCQICGRAFRDRNDYHKHMNQHIGKRQYVCEVCSDSFYTLKALQHHAEATGHVNRNIPPLAVGRVGAMGEDLEGENLMGNEQTLYRCGICDSVFTALERVLEHQQELQTAQAEQGDSAAAGSTEPPAPNRVQYFCKVCELYFIAECLANQHVRQLHSGAVSSFPGGSSASAAGKAAVNI